MVYLEHLAFWSHDKAFHHVFELSPDGFDSFEYPTDLFHHVGRNEVDPSKNLVAYYSLMYISILSWISRHHLSIYNMIRYKVNICL